MNGTADKYWNLIAKKLAHTLSPEESSELENWLAADEANRKLLQELQTVWAETNSYGHIKPDVTKGWNNLSQKLGLDRDDTAVKGKGKVYGMFTIAKAVAAVFIMVIAGWLILQYVQQPQWAEMATTKGETKKIGLPDGSVIWLAENSALSYLKNLGTEKKRQVQLMGEAFFDVAKKPQNPFVIEAGETITEVLGTSFNIKAIRGDDGVQVSVVTGKVRFSGNKKDKVLTLEPGTAGIYTNANQHLEKKVTSNTNFLFWKDQKLNFENATLQEVLDDLSEHYGVTFQLQNNNLANQRITTSFQNDSIENVIAVLETVLDIKLEKKGDTYLVR